MLATFGVGQVLLSMIWFFLFLMWIMLLFQVYVDIFRSPDLSGVAKVAWLIFVIVLPYLGAFVYIVSRGGKMHEHHVAQAQAQEAAVNQYIRQAAGTGSIADELERLAALKAAGTIDDAEFAALKAKLTV